VLHTVLPLVRDLAVTGDALPDRIEQSPTVERLGQELEGAGLHRSHRHGDVAVTREKDDGDLKIRLGELLLQIESAQPRQFHIQHLMWHLPSTGDR